MKRVHVLVIILVVCVVSGIFYAGYLLRDKDTVYCKEKYSELLIADVRVFTDIVDRGNIFPAPAMLHFSGFIVKFSEEVKCNGKYYKEAWVDYNSFRAVQFTTPMAYKDRKYAIANPMFYIVGDRLFIKDFVGVISK